MKLVIAEKPDQAAKLAAPFSFTKKTGYYEVKANSLFPNGAKITWAIGHLCELKSPEEYETRWKKWSFDTLPIIPTSFEYKVTKTKYKQFSLIKQLVQQPDISEIIIGGDAGREGELIIRTILRLCNVHKPMKRLWISSLTENAVKNGFSQLLSEADTRNIYYEALSRACADWLIGMNASRLYTLLLKEKGLTDVYSIGRVQTPTLALIVKRENEINRFKPEPYWEVNATFSFDNKELKATWHKDDQTKITTKNEATAIAAFCKGKAVQITDVKKEKKEYPPPFLFNLSSLQAAANRAYKFSPQKTLDTTQRLYLKGVVSYPRSDSQFLTKEEAIALPSIMEKIKRITGYEDLVLQPGNSLMNNKRYVNDKKVTDHHAIIPTEQTPNMAKLSADEVKIYDLIVRQVIAAHYPHHIVSYTTISSLVDKRATFVSKGKEQIQAGWRKVIFTNKEDSDELLPPLEVNECGDVKKVDVKEKKTQAPKRYTEGNLITLMKTAGKHLEDSSLEKILMQTEGLGTEATRAGIINVLKNRNYIQITRNQVFATTKGMLLISALDQSILASPEMTAKWEQRLREIGQGKASPKAFIEQAKRLSLKLIEDARTQSNSWNFDAFDTQELKEKRSYTKKRKGAVVGTCQKCTGNVIDKGTFYGCSNYTKTKCDFTLSKKILGKAITKPNIQKLLTTGETSIIKGFKKGDKIFDAALSLNKQDFRVTFKFL